METTGNKKLKEFTFNTPIRFNSNRPKAPVLSNQKEIFLMKLEKSNRRGSINFLTPTKFSDSDSTASAFPIKKNLSSMKKNIEKLLPNIYAQFGSELFEDVLDFQQPLNRRQASTNLLLIEEERGGEKRRTSYY